MMERDHLRVMLTDEEAVLATLDGEVRGEPLLGQLAVACVLRNRQQAKHQGRSLAYIATAPYQFSCWWGQDSANTIRCYQMAEEEILHGDAAYDPQLRWIVDGLLSGDLSEDVARSACWYMTRELYNSSSCPAWAKDKAVAVEIGAHIFLKAV